MVSVRDFIGSSCPCCSQDILQAAPSTNRMPGEAELAWCPGCDARLGVQELLDTRRQAAGWLGRVFGRAQRG